MKVVVFVLSCILLFCNSKAQADMVGLTLNAGYANLSLSGRGGDHLFSQPLAFSDNGWKSWSLAFEHPVPLLPNVILRGQKGDWSGDTLLAGDLQLAGQSFASQSNISNALSFKTTDVSFYYEVLDNNLLSVDLGATAMKFDAELAATEPGNSQRSVSTYLPLLYVNLTAQVWGTDSTLFWQGNYTDFQSQQWSQTKAGFAYQFVDMTALTMAVKLGWQRQSIKMSDKDHVDLDMQLNGPYLALEADF